MLTAVQACGELAIIPATDLRPYLVDALERGMARADGTGQGQTGRVTQLCSGSAELSAVGSSRDTGAGAATS